MESLAVHAKNLLNIELTAIQLEAFQIYYTEMLAWNERTNLTGITDYQEVQVKHFLDALTLASPTLRGEAVSTVFDISEVALIDMGAGAGFPGLPLKLLYPKMRLTLVDSVGKKTAFLSHLVGKLRLEGVTVLTGRAEDLGQQQAHRERYNMATGRAVANLAVLAEYCLPLCKVGGLFVAPKKGQLDKEITLAQPAIKLLGGELRQTPTFEFEPETHDQRQLLVVDKIAPTPSAYPRRAGLPAKRPIT